MPSPVLDLIEKRLLVTEVEEPLSKDIKWCLGKTKEGQQCRNDASNSGGRETANGLKDRFAAMGTISHDEAFYQDVRRFIQLIHCTPPRNLTKAEPHAAAALRNFESWKNERILAYPQSSGNLGSNTTDGQSTDHELGRHAQVSQPAPKTPIRKTTGISEPDVIEPNRPSPDSIISTAGDDSGFDFGATSPASTAITTPGSVVTGTSPTAIDSEVFDFGVTARDGDPDIQREPEYSSEDLRISTSEKVRDRPGTPTPLPRKRNASIPINTYAEIGPLGISAIRRRNTTSEQRHSQLLEVIRAPFNKTEYKRGMVYVWKHKQPGLRYVKIGFTGRTVAHRRKDPGNCYAKDTVDLWESDEPFMGASRVEKIVHRHLREWLAPVDICRRCTKGHREWFDKDADEVRAVVQGWTNFARIAYQDGRLSAAARQAVAERIHDMQPDVAALVTLLASGSAKTPISVVVVKEVVPMTQEGPSGDETHGDTDPSSVVAVEGEQHSISLQPRRSLVGPDDPVSPRTIPPSEAAAPAKPKWWDVDWKGRKKSTTKAVRNLLHGNKPARQDEPPPVPGRSGHPPVDREEENKMTQIFQKALRRLGPEPESGKSRRGTKTANREDQHALRERVSSWMPKPRRAMTYS